MPTPGKSSSMRQIAVAAGVSVATVSHVINGSGRFSEDTRKRVEAAIEEYGYVTNMAAKSLRVAQSRTIGMIVPDISNDFFSKIALHVERELATEDYSVFVCNSANDPARERDYFRTLASKQADGIICISGLRRLDGEFVPHGIPVVCIDRAPENDLGFPHVGSNNIGGGYMATEHLIERGCKNILSISSFTANYPGNERQMGYERALAAHGMPLRRDYQLFVSGKQPSIIESEELVTDFLSTGCPVDGIFAHSDHAAVGALRALVAAGKRVPEDVRLIGFDDSVYAQIPTPQISTIRRFPERLAHEGCQALLALLRGEKPEMETLVPVKLVQRASS